MRKAFDTWSRVTDLKVEYLFFIGFKQTNTKTPAHSNKVYDSMKPDKVYDSMKPDKVSTYF